MWIIIVIVLIVIILVAVVKNDNKQIQIDHLQNGGFRKSYPLVTKCLEEEYEMSFFEDLGNSFSYSKNIIDINNRKGTIFIGLKLNAGRETILFSTYINSDGVKYEGMDVSTIYDSNKYICEGISISIEKLVKDGVLPIINNLIDFTPLHQKVHTNNINNKNNNIDETNQGTRIFVEKAGTLSKLIPKENEKTVSYLILSGKINQMDLWIINIMGDGVDFASGYNLKELDMSEAIIEDDFIKDLRFYKCKKLEYVKLPNNTKIIQESAFASCENLKWVHLGSNIEYLEKAVFQDCKSLQSVSFGDKLLYIGESAFLNCSSFKAIKLPSSLLKIGKKAFYSCESLKEIEIPNSVNEIGESAFEKCNSITTLIISENISVISEKSFQYCDSISAISIPNNVKTIEDYAFANCTDLESISIGENLKELGANVFNGCISLNKIDVDERNSYFCSINGVLFNKEKTILIKYPAGKKEISYKVPESVTSIGFGAFSDFNLPLQKIVLPDNLISISNNAFSNCNNLTNIQIPKTVIKIGEEAFMFCENLVSITLPPNIEQIENGVFQSCGKLTSIVIPNSVRTIGDWAFFCSGINFIQIPNSVKSMGINSIGCCENIDNEIKCDLISRYGKNIYCETNYNS